MKTRSSLVPQIALWGLCLITLGWLTATLSFETHLGWPVTGVQWLKRLAGWGFELLLVRALVLGAGRCLRAFHQ